MKNPLLGHFFFSKQMREEELLPCHLFGEDPFRGGDTTICDIDGKEYIYTLKVSKPPKIYGLFYRLGKKVKGFEMYKDLRYLGYGEFKRLVRGV